jgi:hypothetical protein
LVLAETNHAVAFSTLPVVLLAFCPALLGALLLRHEGVTFVLCCAAGDEIYREWGWNMFRAFERWTRRESGGYATVTNVNSVSLQACAQDAATHSPEVDPFFVAALPISGVLQQQAVHTRGSAPWQEKGVLRCRCCPACCDCLRRSRLVWPTRWNLSSWQRP